MYAKFGLYLIAALLPSYLLRFSVAGLPSTILEVMIVAVFVTWVVESKWRPNLHVPKFWLFALGGLLLAATVAIFVAPNHWAATGIWRAYFLEPMLLFVVAIHVLKNREDVQNLFMALAVGSLFVSIIAIFQFITGVGIPTPWDVERRVTSLFPYPNAVGLYLGPIIVIGVSVILNHFVILRRPERSTKDLLGFFPFDSLRSLRVRMTPRIWLWIATVLLGFIAIILAQSEAAIAAVLLTTFAIFLLDKRTRKFAAAAAVIVIILAATIAPLRNFVWQKISFQDFSGTVRRAQWAETIEMLKDRPLLGAGLSGYKTAVAPYHKHPEWEIFQYPHQIVLNVWTELGALGLLAFIYLAVLVVRSVLPLFKGELEGVTVAAFAALLEMTLHGLVDVPYFKNDLAAMTWLLFAVLVILRSEATKNLKI